MICDCPGCTDVAKYREPTSEHIEASSMDVCSRHLDYTKDGIERINE